jgi:hypothetical protein
MAGLSVNLEIAQGAVKYVKSVLPLGAGNNGEDVLVSGGASLQCVMHLRDSYPDSITNGNQTDGWIKSVASRAGKAGCGNCGEQSAVAIVYLLEYSADSLDLMAFDPLFFDHVFVVIGRAKGSTVNRISTWGPNAVVCNPWQPIVVQTYPNSSQADRRVYPAYAALSRMPPYLPAGEPHLKSVGRWDF